MANEGALSKLKARRAKKRERVRSRGIYVLPALLTTGSLFSGFYSIVAAIDLRFQEAAWAIAVAGIFDGLDGRVARLTKTTSEFGVQYDSLSDLISFGMAPAILAYQWALLPYQRWGWVAAFLYVVCAAIRLARYNIQQEEGEGMSYFMGLPSPAAAGLIVSAVLVHQRYLDFFDRFDVNGIEGTFRHPAAVALVFIDGLLMVSEIPFRSPKEINVVDKSRYRVLVLFVAFLAVGAIKPALFLFAVGYVYALSNILLWLVTAGRGISEVEPPPEGESGFEEPEEEG